MFRLQRRLPGRDSRTPTAIHRKYSDRHVAAVHAPRSAHADAGAPAVGRSCCSQILRVRACSRGRWPVSISSAPEATRAFADIATTAVSVGWMHRCWRRGVVAGWLIALMVWMMPGADSSRAFIIVVMTYLVALGNLPHGIAGSVDGFFLVARGALSWRHMLGDYLPPVLIGNTIGGVSLVAFFNHAQVVFSGDADRLRRVISTGIGWSPSAKSRDFGCKSWHVRCSFPPNG